MKKYTVKKPGGRVWLWNSDLSLETIKEMLSNREIDLTWLVYEADDANGAVPLAKLDELVNPSQRTSKETDRAQSRTGAEHSTAKKPPTVLIFQCVACSASIRAATSKIGKQPVRFSCGQCKQAYYGKVIDSDGFGFLIIPEVPTQRSEEPPVKQRAVPPHVLSALKAFGLDPSASMTEVRSAFRQMIAKYHPDKVHHLGDELKIVAEKKTKELNEQFATLEKFFS